MRESLSFAVVDGRLSIGDPMFDDNRTYQAGNVTYHVPAVYDRAAKKGYWRARIVAQDYAGWGRRVSEFVCWHESAEGEENTPELISSEIGVDSATVCIYESLEGLEECWTAVEEEVQAGPRGACSTSGIGDGEYTAYGRSENDELVVVRVVYIPDARGRLPD
jgi:hypothetical protein